MARIEGWWGLVYREPEYLPWDGRRVPITFLGGYLGAGKTTAINELLSATDRPIAVLVNDVGAINVDAGLIRRRHGDTIELTNGCICCSSIDEAGQEGVVRTIDGGLTLVQVVGHRCETTQVLQSEQQPPTDLVVVSLVG